MKGGKCASTYYRRGVDWEDDDAITKAETVSSLAKPRLRDDTGPQ